MPGAAIPVVQLGDGHRRLLQEHFAALPTEDIRRRFGILLDRDGVAAYIARIDFRRDCVFAVMSDDLSLAGVVHLGCRDGAAELGLSILPPYRRQGIATALFQRAVTRARNLQAVELFVHCLASNAAMLHIARQSGMRVVLEQGEADAFLELPPATAATLGADIAAQQTGLFDYTLKAQVGLARRFADGLAVNFTRNFPRPIGGRRRPPAAEHGRRA